MLAVSTPTGHVALLAHITRAQTASRIQIDARSTARALLLMNPIFADLTALETNDILRRAEGTASFPQFLATLEGLLVNDPDGALDGTANPDLYNQLAAVTNELGVLRPLEPSLALARALRPPENPSQFLTITEDTAQRTIQVENKLRHIYVAQVTDTQLGDQSTFLVRESSVWSLLGYLFGRQFQKTESPTFADGFYRLDFFSARSSSPDAAASEALALNLLSSFVDIVGVAVSISDVPVDATMLQCALPFLNPILGAARGTLLSSPTVTIITNTVAGVAIQLARPKVLKCIAPKLAKQAAAGLIAKLIPVISQVMLVVKSGNVAYATAGWMLATDQTYGVFYPEGLKVLITQGHNEWYSTSDSGQSNVLGLISLLNSAAYTTDVLTGPVTPSALTGYDVILVPVAQIPFSEAELSALREFVQAGGGALILTDWGPDNSWSAAGASISATFAIVPDQNSVVDSTGNEWIVFSKSDGTVKDHLTTRRVSDVQAFAMTSLQGPGTPVVVTSSLMSPAAAPVAIAGSLGNGRYVVLGDSNWFGVDIIPKTGRAVDGLKVLDNRRFALNTIDWLATGAAFSASARAVVLGAIAPFPANRLLRPSPSSAPSPTGRQP